MRLFTSWGWNAGKDQIDSGYDLCVGPDHNKYKGARFLVQVKGTANKKPKNTITAPVSKARLRQYTDSVLPVFIVRVTSDGGIYWVHVQEWAKAYPDKLLGAGISGVNIDQCNSLNERETFEKYLETAFRSAPTHGRPICELDEEIALLNSLDPNFGVRIRKTEGGKEHEIFSKQEGFEAKVSFRPQPDEENIANLRDAIHYGLPRDIEVEKFSVVGSPVFDHLSGNSFTGKLSIGTATQRSGYLVLYSGDRYSVTSASLSTDVKLYSGTHGLAISNEKCSCPFNVVLRFASQSAGRLNTTIGLRDEELAKQPLKNFDSLRPLTEWVDQVIFRKAILLEVKTQGQSLHLPILREKLEDLYPLLHWWRNVSRLHLIAKFINSEFVLHKGIQISEADLSDINLAYAILKGDKLQLRALEMKIETDNSFEDIDGKILHCTTTLAIEIQGQPLGEFPVALEFIGYKIERLPDNRCIRIYSDEKSEAWLSYDDNPEAHRSLRKPLSRCLR